MQAPILEDLLAPGLRMVFCGTAPSRVSAARKAYYAHPQNRFWRTLHEVGLTPRLLRPDEYRQLLTFGIGLTDIAKNVYGMDKDLPSRSLGRTATQALRERVESCTPRILGFTSVTGASKFLGRPVAAGKQLETMGTTVIWALPSPSPAAAWNWRIEPWQELTEFARAPGQLTVAPA